MAQKMGEERETKENHYIIALHRVAVVALILDLRGYSRIVPKNQSSPTLAVRMSTDAPRNIATKHEI